MSGAWSVFLKITTDSIVSRLHNYHWTNILSRYLWQLVHRRTSSQLLWHFAIVQQNKQEYKQSDCIIALNRVLLDFLHLSWNFFLSNTSNIGMLHWPSWLLTLVFQGRLYRIPHTRLWATRNLCMCHILKLHHNCDGYMGVQKEWKSSVFNCIEHMEKQTRSLFSVQYWYRICLWMSLSFDSSVCSKLPDICSGNRFYALTTRYQ